MNLSPCRLPCQRAEPKGAATKGIVGIDVGDPGQENVSAIGHQAERNNIVARQEPPENKGPGKTDNKQPDRAGWQGNGRPGLTDPYSR